MTYTVYIIYSELKNKYYIGYTGDELAERIRKHNSNHTGFTGGAGDWKVMFFEKFNEKEIAMKREKELKSWKSRNRIEKLVQGIPS
jgi:putative endonuclease